MKIYELEYLVINLIKDYTSSIIKDEVTKERLARDIAPVLIKNGYSQTMLDGIYKKYDFEEIKVLRLNKEIQRVYDSFRVRIDEFLEDNIEYSLVRYDDHFGLALVDFIREDLSTGHAPFENTEENVKTIYEYLMKQDFFFDAINNNLKYVYDDIASKQIIIPMVIVEEPVYQSYSTEDTSSNNPEQEHVYTGFGFNIV